FCSPRVRPRSRLFFPYTTLFRSVAIVIHNYRWRLGLAEGEPKYDDLEQRLATAPVIAVPTITLEGDANGAPHPEPSAYAKKFSRSEEHTSELQSHLNLVCRLLLE